MTRWTIRIALALYVAALAARPSSRLGRACSATGLLFYLAHVVAAFQLHHGWSHAAAYKHTAQRTAEVVGLYWGGGLWWNYLFGFVWLGDVVWRGPRPRWAGPAIHGFLAFLAFNATVVFESGPVRWAGLAATLGLLTTWLVRRRR
jgi:hypothetical protein